jgi:hypothetical protein
VGNLIYVALVLILIRFNNIKLIQTIILMKEFADFVSLAEIIISIKMAIDLVVNLLIFLVMVVMSKISF